MSNTIEIVEAIDDAERVILARINTLTTRVMGVEAKLEEIRALLTPPAADKNEEQWRCGCWPKPMGAPPGVLCKGCGSKTRWRP